MKQQTPHIYAPQHIKLSDKEKELILKKFHVDFQSLPRIRVKDPMIADLKLKEGDVIKVLRKSPTAGDILFYRGVIHE